MVPRARDIRRAHLTAWVSLGLSRMWRMLFAFAGVSAGTALTRALQLNLHGRIGMLKAMASIVAPMVAAVALPSVLTRWSRLHWLAELALPLDREAYLTALDGAARHAAFEVTVDLGDSDAPELPADLETAAVDVANGQMRVLSPTMRTWRAGLNTYAYNGSLHNWFAQLADEVLVPLHRRSGVSSVSVRFVKAAAPAAS